MNDEQKRTLSAHVDGWLIDYIDERAKVEGVSRSGLVERMLRAAVGSRLIVNDVPFKVVGEINCRGAGPHPLDSEQPAVQLLECEACIWPRHVVRVFAEFGETVNVGSSDDSYLWHPGGRMEKCEPDRSWLKRKESEFEKRRRELM